MYAVSKKIFLACMLTLVVLTTGAWQSNSSMVAQGLETGVPVTPLYSELTWTSLGSSTRGITLNIDGDTVNLSGEAHQAKEQFAGRMPQNVLDFYSNEALAAAGWASFNAYESADGVHYVFYNEDGYYLSVEYLDCAGGSCLTVWQSEQTDSAAVAPSFTPDLVSPMATDTFSKLTPAKNTGGLNPFSTTLTWEAYSGTQKYSYCVREGEICELNDPNWTGTYLNRSVTLTNLDYNRTYYWQIKAITDAYSIPKKYVLANNGTWWVFTTKPINANTVVIVGNVGIPGAVLTYVNATTKTVTADSTGNYIIPLPIFWTGTITPSKVGYTFSPPSASYNNLTAAQTIQNFIAVPNGTTPLTINGNAGVAGAVLSYFDVSAKTAIADSSGAYSFTVTPGWSGTVIPSKGSYYFTPPSRTYTAITSNQTSQNYTISIFYDVPSTYWAFNYIERLYQAGITGGCILNPLSYCPENTVTRAEMAVFLLRGIMGKAYVPPAVGSGTGFTDVPTSHWAATWIKDFGVRGITAGCGTNLYCPEGLTTQAQMAIFLLRSKHGAAYNPPAVGSGTGFSDVPTTYWAAAWIKQLAAEGISSGCGGGNFCPDTYVTRAQMAALVVKTFNLP